MKRKQSFKEYCKEHKEELIVGAIAVVGIVAGVVLTRKAIKHRADGKKIVEALKEATTNLPHETHRFVDEDIFTNIAPQIEDLVLTEGVDEGLIEATYKVAYPLGGDAAKGFYNVKKYVKVLVQDAGDWEE